MEILHKWGCLLLVEEVLEIVFYWRNKCVNHGLSLRKYGTPMGLDKL